jgi:hypothetical protein
MINAFADEIRKSAKTNQRSSSFEIVRGQQLLEPQVRQITRAFRAENISLLTLNIAYAMQA